MAQRCYLHRDLKLANIFLNDGRAIIADFGFAKKHSYLAYNIEMCSKNKNTMSAVHSTCHLKPSRKIYIQ